MQVYLVATPDLSFGDLLRLSLEQENAITVRLANTLDQLMDAVASEPVQLLILDGDLSTQPLDTILREVLVYKHALQVIVILPEKAPDWQSDISNPVAVLRQPCFISDVLEKVEMLMGIKQSIFPDSSDDRTARLSQPSHRALTGYILSSFLRESSVNAVLVLVESQLQLTRGYIEPAELQEIGRLFNKGWSLQPGGEVIHYIQSETSQMRYLVYTREFLKDILLVLVGDVRDSITEMRHQADKLVQMLNDAFKRFDFNKTEFPSAWKPEYLGAESVTSPQINLDELSPGEDLQREKLLEILSEMPPPDPGVRLAAKGEELTSRSDAMDLPVQADHESL